MACLYSERGLFGRQKRTWATWGKTTTDPHDAGKVGQFFKTRVFHEFLVGLGVDGPHKTAEYLQNTLKARLPLVVAGSQSALYPRGLQVRFLQEKFRMRAAQPQEARLNHLTRWYNPPPCRNNPIRLENSRAQGSVRHAKMGMSVMPPVATLPPELSRHLLRHPNRYQNGAQTCA